MVLTYATVEDLAAEPWKLTPAPPDAGRLLMSASLLVAEATDGAVYDTDDDGAPTDEKIAAAMRDATCSQVSTWIVLGVDPAAAGADAATSSGRIATSKTIAGATLAYSGIDQAVAQRAAVARTLTGEARSILASAGLLRSVIRVTG